MRTRTRSNFLVLVLAALTGVLVPSAGHAQGDEEAAVREVVETIFRGMRQADSTLVRSVFDPGARFAMLSDEGEVRYAPVDGWIAAVGQSEGRWDERVYDVRVEVDLPIASVWAPYTFYLDGAVRHCGVNTIEMLRTDAGWRITQISDSRRTGECPDPLAGGDSQGRNETGGRGVYRE